jgi:thiamine biosynthesis protein ThiS
MELRINGQAHLHSGAPSIAAVLEALRLPDRAVLVELNGTALRRDEWPAQVLKPGDGLEIIRIVAGG